MAESLDDATTSSSVDAAAAAAEVSATG